MVLSFPLCDPVLSLELTSSLLGNHVVEIEEQDLLYCTHESFEEIVKLLLQLVPKFFTSRVVIAIKKSQIYLIPILSMKYEISLQNVVEASCIIPDSYSVEPEIKSNMIEVTSFSQIFEFLLTNSLNRLVLGNVTDQSYFKELYATGFEDNEIIYACGISNDDIVFIHFKSISEKQDTIIDELTTVIKHTLFRYHKNHYLKKIAIEENQPFTQLRTFYSSQQIDFFEIVFNNCGFKFPEEVLLVRFLRSSTATNHHNSNPSLNEMSMEVPTHLFLLAGQSNMAGRGKISDLEPLNQLLSLRSQHRLVPITTQNSKNTANSSINSGAGVEDSYGEARLVVDDGELQVEDEALFNEYINRIPPPPPSSDKNSNTNAPNPLSNTHNYGPLNPIERTTHSAGDVVSGGGHRTPVDDVDSGQTQDLYVDNLGEVRSYMDNRGHIRQQRHYQQISYFDPMHGWLSVEKNPILHYNVDILKRQVVGIGLGTTFACRYFDILTASQSEDDPLPCIGLIPTAVGGTSLNEWMPAYLPDTLYYHPSETTKPSPSTSGDSGASVRSLDSGFDSHLHRRTGMYHPGCWNLLSCALRSVYLALYTSIRDNHHNNINKSELESHLRGIAWYQGCNDAAETEITAKTYGQRFQVFIKYVREVIMGIEMTLREQERERREKEEAAEIVETVGFNDSVMSDGYTDGLNDDVGVGLDSKDCCCSTPLYMHSEISESAASVISPSDSKAISYRPPRPAPVVSIAITMTKPFPSCGLIRRQQLLFPRTVPVLAVVDSLGYALADDRIHLTTPGLLDLGERVACVMADLIASQNPIDDKHQCKTADESWNEVIPIKDQCATHHIDFIGYNVNTNKLIGRYKNLIEIYNDALELSESHLNQHPEIFDGHNANQLTDLSFPYSTSTTSRIIVATDDHEDLISSGLTPSNFISGDIRLLDFLKILDRIVFFGENTIKRNSLRKFYDLGCGSGNALIGAYLSGYFSHIIGIELNRSKAIQSHSVLSSVEYQLSKTYRQTSDDLNENILGKFRDQSFQIVYGNFLSEQINWWGDADVVYAASTVFASDAMEGIVSKLGGLKQGAYIILLDKRIEDFIGNNEDEFSAQQTQGDRNHPSSTPSPARADVLVSMLGLKCISNCQARASWGEAAVFVYKKI